VFSGGNIDSDDLGSERNTSRLTVPEEASRGVVPATNVLKNEGDK
jgi:hypothetical protein